MSVHGLGSSLLFGAAASIAFVTFQWVLAPMLGSYNAIAICLAGCLVAYSALIGRTMRVSVRNAFVSSVGSGVVLVSASALGSGIGEVAIGLTFVLALVRSGLDREERGARLLVVEATLGVASLALVVWLASPAWLGSAFALWGYALVQSLYFLIRHQRCVRQLDETGDPFERAHERLLAILEGI